MRAISSVRVGASKRGRGARGRGGHRRGPATRGAVGSRGAGPGLVVGGLRVLRRQPAEIYVRSSRWVSSRYCLRALRSSADSVSGSRSCQPSRTTRRASERAFMSWEAASSKRPRPPPVPRAGVREGVDGMSDGARSRPVLAEGATDPGPWCGVRPGPGTGPRAAGRVSGRTSWCVPLPLVMEGHRLKAPFAFSTACFRLPETRSTLPFMALSRPASQRPATMRVNATPARAQPAVRQAVTSTPRILQGQSVTPAPPASARRRTRPDGLLGRRHPSPGPPRRAREARPPTPSRVAARHA